MKGTRLLDNDEIRRVSKYFDGIFEARNRGLFMIGVCDKSVVKGDEVSRAGPVNRDGRRTIEDLISWHDAYYENTIEFFGTQRRTSTSL